MKTLKLCLLLALWGNLIATKAPAAAPPLELQGDYQALLYSGDDGSGSPTGLLTLKLTKTGKATGKLTTAENKTYPFTAQFDYVAEAGENGLLGEADLVNDVTIARKNQTSLTLSLAIAHYGDGNTLTVTLVEAGEEDRVSESGFQNITFAPKTGADWAGKYTLALTPAEAAGAGDPQGSGYAAVTVASNGSLKLVGKAGDGVSFTASLPAGPNRRYVAYLNPYKTAGSFLAGQFSLVSRTSGGFHVVPAESPEVDFFWNKSGKEKDKSYPLGFGAISLLATMEPWGLQPKQTVAGAFGVASDDSFEIAFTTNFNTTTYAKFTPLRLGMTSKNAVSVAAGGTGSPSPLQQSDWAKIFTAKINPATGVVTGSLNITDVVAGKTVKRKLTLEGVMLNLETIGEQTFATGFLVIPPLDKTGTAITAAFGFNGPIETDPLLEDMAQIAGNYQAIFDVIPGGTPPKGIPADDSTVNFSVSADLKTLTFNGRKLALQGDARPLNLVYFSMSKPILNVTLTMNLVTGEIQKCDATYIHLSGFIPTQYSVLSRNNPFQTIVKLP